MILQELLYKISIKSIVGNTTVEVNGLEIDSRKVSAGNAFVALKGTINDGHIFISEVEKKNISVSKI